jgi:hypothetical protein
LFLLFLLLGWLLLTVFVFGEDGEESCKRKLSLFYTFLHLLFFLSRVFLCKKVDIFVNLFLFGPIFLSLEEVELLLDGLFIEGFAVELLNQKIDDFV